MQNKTLVLKLRVSMCFLKHYFLKLFQTVQFAINISYIAYKEFGFDN